MNRDMIASRRGFTLFEIIVAIAILSIVTSIGATSFGRVTTLWNETKSRTDLDRQLDNVFNTFQQDLADTLSAELSGQAILGIEGQTKDEQYFDRVLADDTVVLPVQHTEAGVRMRSGSKVAWAVARDGEEQPLVRTSGNLNLRVPEGPGLMITTGANVVRFRVEYSSAAQPGKWRSEWESEAHPSAVRISLVLADPNRPWIQVGRKAVFPVNVR